MVTPWNPSLMGKLSQVNSMDPVKKYENQTKPDWCGLCSSQVSVKGAEVAWPFIFGISDWWFRNSAGLLCECHWTLGRTYLAGPTSGVWGRSLKVVVSKFGDNMKTSATSREMEGGACFILWSNLSSSQFPWNYVWRISYTLLEAKSSSLLDLTW